MTDTMTNRPVMAAAEKRMLLESVSRSSRIKKGPPQHE
jgi:hypothetical protein